MRAPIRCRSPSHWAPGSSWRRSSWRFSARTSTRRSPRKRRGRRPPSRRAPVSWPVSRSGARASKGRSSAPRRSWPRSRSTEPRGAARTRRPAGGGECPGRAPIVASGARRRRAPGAGRRASGPSRLVGPAAGALIALLAWVVPILLERRRVLRELSEEVRLGILPGEDLAVLVNPWRRVAGAAIRPRRRAARVREERPPPGRREAAAATANRRGEPAPAARGPRVPDARPKGRRGARRPLRLRLRRVVRLSGRSRAETSPSAGRIIARLESYPVPLGARFEPPPPSRLPPRRTSGGRAPALRPRRLPVGPRADAGARPAGGGAPLRVPDGHLPGEGLGRPPGAARRGKGSSATTSRARSGSRRATPSSTRPRARSASERSGASSASPTRRSAATSSPSTASTGTPTGASRSSGAGRSAGTRSTGRRAGPGRTTTSPGKRKGRASNRIRPRRFATACRAASPSSTTRGSGRFARASRAARPGSSRRTGGPSTGGATRSADVTATFGPLSLEFQGLVRSADEPAAGEFRPLAERDGRAWRGAFRFELPDRRLPLHLQRVALHRRRFEREDPPARGRLDRPEGDRGHRRIRRAKNPDRGIRSDLQRVLVRAGRPVPVRDVSRRRPGRERLNR